MCECAADSACPDERTDARLWPRMMCVQVSRSTHSRLRPVLERIAARHVSTVSTTTELRAPPHAYCPTALLRRYCNGTTRWLTSHLALKIQHHTGTQRHCICPALTHAQCPQCPIPHCARHPLHSQLSSEGYSLLGPRDRYLFVTSPDAAGGYAAAAPLAPLKRLRLRDPWPPQAEAHAVHLLPYPFERTPLRQRLTRLVD